MKFAMLCALLCSILSACYQGHSDDDLRGVPVTNNPSLFPSSTQTVQGPPLGN